MKCDNCGSENSDTARFCKSCGASLASDEKSGSNNRIIIALIAVAAILLLGVLLYASGVFTPEAELQSQEFNGFKLDVPVDSKFVLDQSFTKNPKSLFVGYLNKADKNLDVVAFQVGNNLTEKTVESFAVLEKEEGDLKIYKNESEDGVFHEVFKKGKDANIVLYGDDVDLMKRMADSFEDKDFDKIYEKEESVKTTSSEPAPVKTTTTTALTILGGSISTGGGLSDKTYAKVFVGPEHAGENVKIQIWYSRDGGYLNNGNMVPKTVSSDGYIEVASASAYEKFPDTAEINIYNNNGALLDTYTVYLNPESGTQTF